MKVTWMEKRSRYFGRDFFYYNGRVYETMGLWFISLMWSTKKSLKKYKKQFPNEFK